MNLTTTDKLLLSALLPSEASGLRLRRLIARQSADTEWEAVVRRARVRSFVPLLRFNLARAGLLANVPPLLRQTLDETSRFQAARHLACVSEATRLTRKLADAGVTAIPLKGVALMLGGYYPQAGLRAVSDIDLLVSPQQLEQAERVAHECGYLAEKYPEAAPGTILFPPHSEHLLPAELNHTVARYGPGGLMLEIHHRAFHYTRAGRDFGFAEMRSRAAPQRHAAGEILLPAAEDLCLHLVHHTLVDLRSTHLILRTLADLYFIEQQQPGALGGLKQRASETGLTGAARTAIDLLSVIREGTLEELDEARRDDRLAALLDGAMQDEPGAMKTAAALFEYFDVGPSLAGGLGRLAAIAFTSGKPLAGDDGGTRSGRARFYYPRRAFDLLRKFDWQSLHPRTVRRLVRLRKIGRPQPGQK
ncbi:MAG TPA: nucleotidyltransferase family protein [Blastocatellia bacterium]|nr:nucleotidyltransferase family protein [Blastocatellia bacterium]